MPSFLAHHGVLVALVCSGAAVVYGIVTSRQLLALSPGNEAMRTISAAVQEGARAYLNRQYTVIAGVGVLLFIVLIPLQNIRVAIGFAIGGFLSAAAGYIGTWLSRAPHRRLPGRHLSPDTLSSSRHFPKVRLRHPRFCAPYASAASSFGPISQRRTPPPRFT